MKLFTRILALALALMMTVSLLAACGSSDGGSSADVTEAANANTPDSAGTPSTWGEISVTVPDGMHMTGGNGAYDPDDPKTAWLYDDENAMHYVKISIVDSEDAAIQNIEMTRSANEEYAPADVSVATDNTEWKGVSYLYSGEPCSTVYGKAGDKVFMVMSYSFDVNSDAKLKTVLNSLS